MKKMKAGLRGPAIEAIDKDRRDGLARGQKWARETAKEAELTRLVHEFSRLDVASWAEGFTEISSVYSPAEIVYFILATNGPSSQRAVEFWKGLEELCDNPGFIAGFIEGAFEVWDELKHKA